MIIERSDYNDRYIATHVDSKWAIFTASGDTMTEAMVNLYALIVGAKQ